MSPLFVQKDFFGVIINVKVSPTFSKAAGVNGGSALLSPSAEGETPCLTSAPQGVNFQP